MTRFHDGGSDPGHAPDQNKNEADRSRATKTGQVDELATGWPRFRRRSRWNSQTGGMDRGIPTEAVLAEVRGQRSTAAVPGGNAEGPSVGCAGSIDLDSSSRLAEPLTPVNRRGVKPGRNREVISGILYGLKFGCRWHDCPEIYGHTPRSTIALTAGRRQASGTRCCRGL
jgi:hypothetical protein